MECSELARRYSILQLERRPVESVWDIISRFVVPFRGEFFRDLKSEGEVDWRNRHKFDDTAVESCNTLASSLQGALTSPVVRWFDLVFRSKVLNVDAAAMQWLRDSADVVHQSLQESNFNLQMSECYLDICSFGTTCLVEEIKEENQEFENLLFKAVPIRECFFEEDVENNVINFYRKLEWTALQIKLKFGEENIPESIKACKDVAQKFTVLFCIYQRKDKMNADTSRVLSAKERPYGWKYLLLADKALLGEEGGYYDMPVFITRWGKASGSQWGYSPAHICLGDVLTLNQLVNMILTAAEKVIDPATLAQERAVIGDLDLGASGVTTVRNIDAIKTFESRARFDVSSLERSELQRSIRQVFKVDQLELKESPAMTATEVQVRYELMQRLLGPTLGRLQNDLLDPLIQRTFFILFRAGRLPEMPPVVQENQSELDIEYLGPMAKAQKMEKIVSVQRWYQLAMPIAEVDPSILDLPDIDAIGREAAQLLDVPLKDEAAILAIREARQAQQQKQAKLAETQASGEAMQSMGKGMKVLQGGGGSPEQVAEG